LDNKRYTSGALERLLDDPLESFDVAGSAAAKHRTYQGNDYRANEEILSGPR